MVPAATVIALYLFVRAKKTECQGLKYPWHSELSIPYRIRLYAKCPPLFCV